MFKAWFLCAVCGLSYFGTKAQQPNILFIVADDLNMEIGPYNGLEGHTPHLDKLAREGVRFNRAYSQYPVCGPSRASFMSGLYPETTGVLSNQQRVGSYKASNPSLANHPSLAGFFREQGYYTARVSKIFHMGVPGGIENGDPGDDDPDSWDYAYNVLGPETLSPGELEFLSPKDHHYGSSFVRLKLEDSHKHAQTDFMATSQAIAILESRARPSIEGARNKIKPKADAPFFLAVGLVRPHLPFIAPEEFYESDEAQVLRDTSYDKSVPERALKQQNRQRWQMDSLQQKKALNGYMASVRFMDQQVGRLLDALEWLALKDETIVVFISDHGFNLGEHDCWQKFSLWEESVQVPMIISYPFNKSRNNTSYDQVVELIDLYPSLLTLTGFREQLPEILQGESFSWYLSGSKQKAVSNEAYTVTSNGKAFSIRTDRWRYTRWGEEIAADNEELYDHENDPKENVNLVFDKRSKKTLAEMRVLLERKRSQARK